MRPDLKSVCLNFDVGQARLAQVAEPVGVARCARSAAPYDETVSGLEVADAGRARDPGSAARGRDHQDMDVFAPTDQSSVGHSIHPDADLVPNPRQPVFQGAHQVSIERNGVRTAADPARYADDPAPAAKVRDRGAVDQAATARNQDRAAEDQAPPGRAQPLGRSVAEVPPGLVR
jgi:hypothetical protein